MSTRKPRPPADRGNRPSSGDGLTRRQVLKGLAAGGLLAGSGLLSSCGQPGSGATPVGADLPSGSALRRDGVVVIVRHPRAIDDQRRVNGEIVAQMVEAGVTRLAETSGPAEAWRRFFSPSDVIGLKVNCLGAPSIHTHTEVALAAAAGLQAAGVAAENLIIFDRLTRELRRAGFAINEETGLRCFGTERRGYDSQPTVVGAVGSCFSRIVSEDCTALLNLPVLKDHDVAGVTIALKNHFGSINNPNKLHPNHCCPYVADLNLAPQIRAKERLVIADALEAVYDGGPTYRPSTTQAYGALLIGTDPVAVDRIGWQIIDDLRRAAGLRTLAEVGREPAYIDVAADERHNLGVADLSRINKIEVSLT